MLPLIAAAQQATHPCIMPPNGSTIGKCQSRDFGICNLGEAKHVASVSPLSLTQHTANGTCPLFWTSSGVSHAMQREGKWQLDMNMLVNLAPPEELLCVMSYSKSHLSAASVGSDHVSFQQMTKYPPRANTHRPSSPYTQHWYHCIVGAQVFP